jgi:putative lipoic acid-binding regulatory protein
MDQEWINNFRTKLDEHYSWPSLYIFKFIVPIEQEDELKKLFPLHVSTEKRSTQGKYVSITFNMMMPSSEAVIEVYQRVAAIEGVIAL